MKKINNLKKAFTLVELLVVITIIAILWVVAYTSFGWATDKAKAATKLWDMNAIKWALVLFKSKNNSYLPVWTYDATTNMWWYRVIPAEKENTLVVAKADWVNIDSITSAVWGWDVTDISGTNNIWQKWVFEYDWPIKEFLKAPAYDREVWDIEVWTTWAKLIDSWIWKYVYATYTWRFAYNLAYTVKDKDWKEVSKIVWDYNEYSCTPSTDCPKTLIWPWWASKDTLDDWDTGTEIPYKLVF